METRVQLVFSPPLCLCAVLCAVLVPGIGAQTTSATFGELISLGGTPSDIVLDESRQRLYLVNSPANRVEVYDYSAKVLLDPVSVGQQPLAAALSMDNAYLYVTNHGDSSLSVIALNNGPGVTTV